MDNLIVLDIPTKPVKISLTGDQGSGKSTLLRMIVKLCEANKLKIKEIDEHTIEVYIPKTALGT